MSDNLRIVRVFIGSPGGLNEERQIAHEVVRSVNKSHSERWGIHFKLMGWEDVVPGFIRPQSKINEDLDRCEYFIGVLWNHWGSRPSKGSSEFTSGFQEEYSRAVDRIGAGLMKDMALYFKVVEVPPGMQPGDDIRKVLDFQDQLIEDKTVFFKDFRDGSEFKDLVREKLEEIGWSEAADAGMGAASNRVVGDTGTNQDIAPADAGLLDDEGRQFLQSLSVKPRDWELTAAHEIARLRLLGAALGRSGNDEYKVGNHDANLLFKAYRDQTLSKQELRALVDCGVSGFHHQNVPLWRWLSKFDEDPWARPKVLAVVGNENAKRYALELLQLAEQPIPILEGLFDRSEVIELWLSESAPEQAFDAAIEFVANNALKEDIPLLDSAFEKASLPRKAQIEEAIVAIISRFDLNAALVRVANSHIDKIEIGIVAGLFDAPKSISTATAVICTSAKSELIRLRAVRLLAERNEVPLDLAQVLLTDGNHEIRLMAAEALLKLGAGLAPEQVKTALQIKKPPNAFGMILGGIGTDTTYYDRYGTNRLLELDLPTLRERVKAAGVFDEEELSAIFQKYGRKVADEMRSGLRDRFHSHFESNLEGGVAAGYITDELRQKMEKLREFVCDKLSNSALNSLCKLSVKDDLALVRLVIDGGRIQATADIIRFLSKHGDWSDVTRIATLGDPLHLSASIFGATRVDLVAEKASAILAIGKNRVADVLALDISIGIKTGIIKVMPRSQFKDIREEMLLDQLKSKDENYRIVISLRMVECLTKVAISGILDRYVDGSEYRYYNVIHWLDFGASFPGSIVRAIAVRKLKSL